VKTAPSAAALFAPICFERGDEGFSSEEEEEEESDVRACALLGNELTAGASCSKAGRRLRALRACPVVGELVVAAPRRASISQATRGPLFGNPEILVKGTRAERGVHYGSGESLKRGQKSRISRPRKKSPNFFPPPRGCHSAALALVTVTGVGTCRFPSTTAATRRGRTWTPKRTCGTR